MNLIDLNLENTDLSDAFHSQKIGALLAKSHYILSLSIINCNLNNYFFTGFVENNRDTYLKLKKMDLSHNHINY